MKRMLSFLTLFSLFSIFNVLALNLPKVSFLSNTPLSLSFPLSRTDASQAAPSLGQYFKSHKISMQRISSGSRNIRRISQRWTSLLRSVEIKTCQYLDELGQIDPKA